MPTHHRTQCPHDHGYELVLLMGNVTAGSGTEEQVRTIYQIADKTLEPLIIAHHPNGDECPAEMARQYEWAHQRDSVFVGWRTRDETHDRGGSPLRITERVINGTTYRFTGSVAGRYITCIVQLMRGKVPLRQVHYVKIRRLKRYMISGPRRNFEEYVTKNGVTIRSWERTINGKRFLLRSAFHEGNLLLTVRMNVGAVEIQLKSIKMFEEGE